jgi:hypothetical protein
MSPTSSTAPASRKTSHKTATRSKPAAATRLVVLRGHAQGRVVLSWRRRPQGLEGGRAALPGPHHQPRATGPARRPHAAGGSQDRPPGADDLPLHQPGPHLERGAQPPAFAAPTGGLPARSVDHTFWLTPGPRQRTRHLVRRHVAAGPVSIRGWRRQLGATARRERRRAVSRMDGHGAGRHTRRPETAFGDRGPARPVAPVLRHVGRWCARVARRRPQLVHADQGPGSG